MAHKMLRRIAKICFDIALFVLLWFGFYAILKWFEAFRRGFFCGDESLAYPYHEDTISIGATAIIVFCVPTLVILTVEMFKHLDFGNSMAKRKVSNGNGTIPLTSSSNAVCFRFGYRLMQCYKHIGYYFFGLGLNAIITEILKRAVGRLRPHFFNVCVPQMLDGTSCDDDSNQGRYITEYICIGQNYSASAIASVNKSFPSGHSSLMWYAMLYLCTYLQASVSTRASKLLKHLLQFVFIAFAAYVSVTRLSDYMHHWSDILAGSILGSIIAIAMALYVSDMFNEGVIDGRRFYKAAYYHHPKVNSSASSTAQSVLPPGTSLPAYTFGTLPFLHYTPHHAQYNNATYQNYGYVP